MTTSTAHVDLTLPAPRGHGVWLALAGFGLLALLAQRGGVRLSFDSYYYVEHAKEFRHHWPASFGDSWPYGWPLVGAAGGLVGAGAYPTLLVAALVSVGVLLHVCRRLLPGTLGVGGGLLVLGAGAGSFSLTVLCVGVFSEVPFAAVLLTLTLCLSRWPQPGAILGSAGLAVLALTLRYAGGLALVLWAGWLVWEWRSLRSAGRLPLALASGLTAALVAAGLLLWNRAVTGSFSGDSQRGSVDPAAWPGIASDLGWALPTACGGHFLRDLLGFATAARLPLGLGLLALPLLLGLAACVGGKSREGRAVGVLIVIYLAGLVALRCLSQFDDLHSGRMIFPVFFPLLIAGAWLPRGRPWFLGGCGLLILLNTALCVRGASLEIGAGVRPAVPLVSSTRWPAAIMVSDEALTLSAHVAAPVRRLDPAQLAAAGESVRFVVLAAAPADRQGRPGTMNPAWEALTERLLADGRHVARLRTPALIVLERLP